MSVDISFWAQRIVDEVQFGTAAFLDEVRGAMTDVREAVGEMRKAASSLRSAGPHFVQSSVAYGVSEGFRGGIVSAVDDKGRVWVYPLYASPQAGWEQLPQHPELF